MRRAWHSILLLVAGSCLLVVGCATTDLGRADLLDFLEDGRTTREQVFLTLGEPSATYQGDTILTFRLAQDDGGYFLVAKRPGFVGVTYSLVLAFDDDGLLKRHALVTVKAP